MRAFETKPAATIWFFTLTLTGLIIWGDVWTGADVVFTPLYFVPISFGAWFAGQRLANLVAAIATASWLWADLVEHADRTVALHAWNFVVQALGFGTIAFLIPRLQAALETAQLRGRVDLLTGVLSRSGFFELAEREVLRARRSGQPLAVLYLDVDDFKKINDSGGHAAGDEALRVLGETLRSELRSIDVVGRIGGDEFVLMLPDTSPATAHQVGARLKHALRAEGLREGLSLGISIGTACFAAPPSSAESLVAAADKKMYEQKERHRKSRQGAASEPEPASPFPAAGLAAR